MAGNYCISNPVSSEIYHYAAVNSDPVSDLKIMDIKGQVVKDISVTLQPGSNKIQVATDQLPEGLYYIKLLSGKTFFVTKFIKVK